MENDKTLTDEWFRICEFVALFPQTPNLSLYIDSTVGIKGLSFGFALEACYHGLREDTVYTGDSSPIYGFLPTESIEPAHMEVKASLMKQPGIEFTNMVMKNPISQMTVDELALDTAPILSANVRDLMKTIPLVS